MKNLVSCKQYESKEQLEEFFDLVKRINEFEWVNQIENRSHGNWIQKKNALEDKIMATLFYEPSTRTRFSFETAMHQLGGKVISSEAASQFSSHAKGESLEDTIKVVSQYADLIVLRHPEEDAAERATNVRGSIIINAGCGSNQHPSQALLDLFTIKKRFNNMDVIKVALVGDLLYSRTIHSLVYLLSLYKGIEICLVSPPKISLPAELISRLVELDISCVEYHDLDEMLIKEVPDVIYLTRSQVERWPYRERIDPLCPFGEKQLELVKDNAIIMHPLPRLKELDTAIDKDKRAVYLTEQIRSGLEVRKGLLYSLLKG